ncbi:hypothetical protein [Winogradskyella sp. PG-2]|uniref:hypothetical protein n=1 Tax=Winogradskyella sp. PG-2 TaxID=754409 RepID=UPI0004588AEC|nr:hypothetical protein [Winogradskyella sp. PG-2]BAO74373.1 hypothetical protein WPG_0143 [Winogradskyella sp. PG-2]
MRYLFKRIIILTITFIIVGCQSESRIDNFNLEVRDFDGSQGYWLTYKINQDSLKIHYNCDFENCKDTILHSIKLDKIKVQKLYSFLKESRLDTLKRKYRNEGYDGLNLQIKISGDSLYDKRISLQRYRHPVIENLMTEIDKSIEVKKYKYHRY